MKVSKSYLCFGLLWFTCLSVVWSCRPGSATYNVLHGASTFWESAADEDAVRPESTEDRLAMLRTAPTYGQEPEEARNGRSLLDGPPIYQYKKGVLDRVKYKEFAFNQAIECDYISPWMTDKPGGKSAKFSCLYTYEKDGKKKSKKLKVKYDNFELPHINTGVYGEVLGTRLLWALGYPTDTVIPVQVRCKSCPSDPWGHISAYWSIKDGEETLRSTDPNDPSYAKTKSNLASAKARLIANTLSVYQRFAKVTVSKQEGSDEATVLDEQNRVLFSTRDGILTLDQKTYELYEPKTQSFRMAEQTSYIDYAAPYLIQDLLKSEPKTTRDFVSAIVEWKHNSIPIETYKGEGWSFATSDREKPNRTVDLFQFDKDRPELRIQREEIALLSAFIAHADNKAEQQRFICRDPEKIEAEDNDCEAKGLDPRDESCKEGTDIRYTSCEKPMLMIQDLGFVMGYGARMLPPSKVGVIDFDSSPEARIYGTANAQGFLDAPLFKDAASCLTTVNRWATGVDIAMAVSEQARLSLWKKLKLLADNEQDLEDLFRAARLHLLEMHYKKVKAPELSSTNSRELLGGSREQAIIDAWKLAFRAKVQRLGEITCPDVL